MTKKDQEKKDRQTSRDMAQELHAEFEEEIGATEAFYNFFDAAAAASAHTEKNDLGRRGYVIDPTTGCPVRGDAFRHEDP